MQEPENGNREEGEQQQRENEDSAEEEEEEDQKEDDDDEVDDHEASAIEDVEEIEDADTPHFSFAAGGKGVLCHWDLRKRETDTYERAKKRLKAAVPPPGTSLVDVSSSIEEFHIMGSVDYGRNPEPKRLSLKESDHKTLITKALCIALTSRLSTLSVENLNASSDPIFGTNAELRRRYQAADYDLFARLALSFPGSGQCNLRKLNLVSGFFSADSLLDFIRVARPPLVSFFSSDCLVHGRNFEKIVKGLRDTIRDPSKLEEFATDACVGGQDPLGLIADCFPNLISLKVPNLRGRQPRDNALARLQRLQRKSCLLPQHYDDWMLGFFIVRRGHGFVDVFIQKSSGDDDYRGEGLCWEGLGNTSECTFSWHGLGCGITNEKVEAFFEECGIEVDKESDAAELLERDDMSDKASEEEQEETNTRAVQIEVLRQSSDEVAIKARKLEGTELAEMIFNPNKMSVRELMQDLAKKFPCKALALRLVLPGGQVARVLDQGERSVATLLM